MEPLVVLLVSVLLMSNTLAMAAIAVALYSKYKTETKLLARDEIHKEEMLSLESRLTMYINKQFSTNIETIRQLAAEDSANMVHNLMQGGSEGTQGSDSPYAQGSFNNLL